MLQIILCIELEKLIFHKKELRLIFLFKFNHMILLDILKLASSEKFVGSYRHR